MAGRFPTDLADGGVAGAFAARRRRRDGSGEAGAPASASDAGAPASTSDAGAPSAIDEPKARASCASLHASQTNPAANCGGAFSLAASQHGIADGHVPRAIWRGDTAVWFRNQNEKSGAKSRVTKPFILKRTVPETKAHSALIKET